MGKLPRILWGVLAAVIVVVAAGGVGYAIVPRDFLQLVLSDAAYTKYTLAKNLSSAYPAAEEMLEKVDAQQAAYETEGAMDVTLDTAMFPSADIANEVSKYISSLSLKSEIYVDGGIVKINGDLADNDGSVFTAETIVDASSAYVKIDQLDTGYMDVLQSAEEAGEATSDGSSGGSVDRGDGSTSGATSGVGSINETYEAIIESGAADDLRDAVYELFDTAMASFDDTLITIIPKKTLEVGSVAATGDVATVVMTADDFKDCIDATLTQLAEDEELFNKINPCLPENEQMTYSQFKAKMLNLADTWVKEIDDSGITNVTLEFYIDKKNDIVAFEAWVMAPETSTGMKAVIRDDAEEGMAVIAERDKEEIFSFDLQKDSKDANSGKVQFMTLTESGPLRINGTYSGYEMSEDTFKLNLVTEKFELPGQEALGAVKLDISVSIENELLSLTVRADIEAIANAVVTLSGKAIEYKDFDLPAAENIVPFDSAAVQEKAIEYVLSDLPKEHESFQKVYSSIVGSTINNMIGRFLNDLTGGLTGSTSDSGSSSFSGDSVEDFISDFMGGTTGGDESDVGGFIGDLLSGFDFGYSYDYDVKVS